MNNFVITVSFLLMGVAARFSRKFPAETGTALNLFVIYFSLPALVLLKIPSLRFSRELLVPTFMPWAMVVLFGLLVLLLARLFRWGRSVTGCLLLMVPLGNTSFLGIPMVQAFFGEQAVVYALVYDQLGSFLALSTYGSLVIALYGNSEVRPTVVSVLRKIVTFPPFLALLLAFWCRSHPYPALVTNFLQMVAATLVPLVMIAVGWQLTLRLKIRELPPLVTGLTLKLVMAPLVALFACKMLGLTSEAAQVAVFEAGMPPMVSAGALALLARLSPALTAALVGLGIVVSFATLPMLHGLLV